MKGKSNAERSEPLFTPIHDQVAIQVIKQRESTGGILLDAVQDKNSPDVPSAWVIEVGPEAKQVKPGDVVLLSHKILATAFSYHGNYYIVLPEKQLYGVLKRA